MPANGSESVSVYNSGSGLTYTSYPCFALRTSSTGKYQVYYIDDLMTERLADVITLNSRESSVGESDSVRVYSTNALDGKTVSIEATVDNTASGDIIAIKDSETYSLLKAENGKLYFGDIVLCNDKGEEIVLGAEATKVVVIYDDNTGTVRFAVGDSLAYYKDGDAIKVTFARPAINGGVGKSATVIGSGSVKVIKATSEIIGSQTHTDDLAVRFIAGVDSIYYTEVGFKLETAENSEIEASNVVYASVKANEKTVMASEYGYNYLSALSLTDIDTDGKVKVTPFLRVGDNDILGTSVYYDIVLDDGVLSISEITENEVGA